MHFYCRAIYLLLFQGDESSAAIKAPGFAICFVALVVLSVGFAGKVLMVSIFPPSVIYSSFIFYRNIHLKKDRRRVYKRHLNKKWRK